MLHLMLSICSIALGSFDWTQSCFAGDHSSFELATYKRAGELGDRWSSHSEHGSGSGSSNCELPSKVPLMYIRLAIILNVFGLDRST